MHARLGRLRVAARPARKPERLVEAEIEGVEQSPAVEEP